MEDVVAVAAAAAVEGCPGFPAEVLVQDFLECPKQEAGQLQIAVLA